MRTARSALVWGGLALLLSGCELNDFFNPAEPKIVAPDQKPLVVPILDTLASGIEGPDAVFTDATDVEPADLTPEITDYKIGPNDLVNISIFDLLGQGTGQQTKTVRVTETGSVSLPFIPPVKAQGLTEHDLEQAVSKAYEDARLIRNARVSVTVAQARARTFSIQGNVGSPGEYQISRPDFRMLDALVASRGPKITLGVPYAFVIRSNTPPGTGPSGEPNSPAKGNSPLTPIPPSSAPMMQPGDLLSPPSTTPSGPQGRADIPASGGRIMVMDNVPPANSSSVFKFDDVQAPSDERIIRVPIDDLRQQGQLKYNIVIRPRDMIIVPDPTTGVYYMGGHVHRAGVFALNGEKVTLKKAWVAVAGGDDFAFPNRAEIVRRIGTNREVCVRVDMAKVLALSEPDIYLKPNDVVYVGTHFIAPLLAAVRNSFRLTYGFGFLYDRNFYSGAQQRQNGRLPGGGSLPPGF
jgi:polysaccharide biosynthesis/export protein